MLNELRGRMAPVLEGVGRRFASTGVSPDAWTAVGLAFAVAAAVVYGTGHGWSLAVGGVLLLASGFFDVVDGQVARVTGRTSARGSFLDSVSDKVAEVAVFMGVMVGGHADPYLVAAALALSLLVSYARSRAESLGVRLQGVGIGERAERLLVVAVVGMIPGMMWTAMAVVVVIAGVTLAQRVVVVCRNLGGGRGDSGVAAAATTGGNGGD